MLESITRLLRRLPTHATDSRLLEDWARERGQSPKRVRGRRGCVIEDRCHGFPARIEWGPPQRNYIAGNELRVRVELGLPMALEMLVMNRALAESLEAQAYDELTRDKQTEIDASLPEEARWLAMFDPVVTSAALPIGREFLMTGASQSYVRRWVEGELATRLSNARDRWLAADTPLVIMTLRGRLYLRTELATPDPQRLDGCWELAAGATLAVLRTLQRGPRISDGSGTGIAGMSLPSGDSHSGVDSLHASLISDPGVSAEEVLSNFDEEFLTNFGCVGQPDVKL